MTCPELEKRLQDIEYHRKELNYFLLRKELHLLADAKAQRSATTVASARRGQAIRCTGIRTNAVFANNPKLAELRSE
jgi:hypothetical protein